jgi:hypothetical protein
LNQAEEIAFREGKIEKGSKDLLLRTSLYSIGVDPHEVYLSTSQFFDIRNSLYVEISRSFELSGKTMFVQKNDEIDYGFTQSFIKSLSKEESDVVVELFVPVMNYAADKLIEVMKKNLEAEKAKHEEKIQNFDKEIEKAFEKFLDSILGSLTK